MTLDFELLGVKEKMLKNLYNLDPFLIPEFISDSEQEEPSLQTRDESLSDQLLEALGVQLPPHLTDALRPDNY